MEIDLGDKANAWNMFVHDILTPARAAEICALLVMDGDVTARPNALPLLAAALEEIPSAKAAGAMPAIGRDRDAWRERMVENATLAGCLYALRGSFVARIRAERIRMPIELIGEDHFVSWLVASELGRRQPLEDGPQCVFHVAAEFSFRSLSLARPGDYRLYLRRKWRYTCRALQHQMLTTRLRDRGLVAMPRDVDELYRVAPLPSRLVWNRMGDCPFVFGPSFSFAVAGRRYSIEVGLQGQPVAHARAVAILDERMNAMRSSWVLGLVLTAACGGRSAGYSPAPSPSPTATPTATDLQVVFVTYVGNQNHWTDPATQGPALIARDNAFWNTARGSWGEISLSGTTYPTWVDSSQSMAGGCQLGQIGLDVKAAIGSWPAGGSIRHIVLPPGTPCNSQAAGTHPTRRQRDDLHRGRGLPGT